MTYWWHFDPGTGFYRHDTKAKAMQSAKEDFELHADHARSEGWSDEIEMLSVWKTPAAKPEDECDDWIEKNGTKVAQAVLCFEQERPEPPADLKGDDLENWQMDNWPIDWDFDRMVDYEIREL